MGSKGSQQEAIRMENTLPKFDEATILIYLILQCVRIGDGEKFGKDLRVAMCDTASNHAIDNDR